MHPNESNLHQPVTDIADPADGVAQTRADAHAPPEVPARGKQPKVRTTGQEGASEKAAKKRKPGRPRVAPYKEGKVWSFRVRRGGLDIYESGFASQEVAYEAMNELVKQLGTGKAPMYGGPGKNSLGKSLQRFGLDHLPGLKGAPQAVRRFNRWLKALGLPTLAILPVAQADQAPKNTTVRKGRYWAVHLVPDSAQVRIPRGLNAHRAALMSKSADSARVRQVLAAKDIAKVGRDDLQRYIQALEAEGLARATVGQEQSLLSGLFNHAKEFWHWNNMGGNAASGLNLTGELVKRERVLSEGEQTRFDEAVMECRVQTSKPAFQLLLETAMRAGEPRNATWGDVDWDNCVIALRETKNGKARKVPLSPAALDALRELGPSQEKQEPIFRMTYESLKAAWRRICERAGLEDLHIQDLRHTAATRMALKTGNVFLVKALTGHETFEMVERYVNVTALDVVKVMHAAQTPAPATPPALPPLQAEQQSSAPADALALMAQLAALSAQLSAQLAAGGGQQRPAPGPEHARARGPAANEPATGSQAQGA
ncbi:integrase [Caenimonas terrae]|uniref:Integrase n=1 Tax=Caenimonas terrae TaxID=696074 RepID=A0ABW0NBF9_9BURK